MHIKDFYIRERKHFLKLFLVWILQVLPEIIIIIKLNVEIKYTGDRSLHHLPPSHLVSPF